MQTLSRPSDNEIYNISQEDLVVAALRFNPDVICVGEMRDVECSAAVEASMTGHTVVSTVHAMSGALAHWRIALLCQKRFPIDFNLSLMQGEQAFPIVVYTHKMLNNDRKIMDISECEMMSDGSRKYRTLFRYHVIRNDIIDGRFVTEMNLKGRSLKRT
ncbi:MAG: Flp pilus assembly complex ATPase component TadA [Ruminococcus sp.]|nr:Flp pilus assembly complex ATPase component TadA [Candidatus Copronaster equi]